MDYEKKYKKLVSKIEKAYLYAQTDSTKAVLEEIRPELRVSKDDGISIGVKEPPSKTFPRVNEFEEGASYRH